jgi:hypothetical protein
MTLLPAGLTWLLALVAGVVVTGLVILGSFDRIARVVTLLCLALLVAVPGTSISLYLFGSRSAHRIEDLRNEPARGRKAVPLGKRRPGQSRRKLHAARLDVLVGTLFSNLVMCPVIVAASTRQA